MGMISYASILAKTNDVETNKYVGGGDILKYMGSEEGRNAFDEMSIQEIIKFAVIPLMKYIAVALVIIIAIMIIMRITKVSIVKRGKGAEKQLKNIEKIRKKEKQLIAVNNFVNKITHAVEHSPFRMSYAESKELQYKIHRADIRSFDGRDLMKAETYNALRVVAKLILSAVGVIMIFTINITLGAMLIIMAITITDAVTDIYIKSRVDAKDAEIKRNFAGFYLMLHYVLMRNPNATLTPVIQSYDKTTDSEEMHKLVDICVHNFSTYGEYSGNTYVAEEYKGVSEVVKLMRLIRQGANGGDIRGELEGFKREILNEEAYRAKQKKEKALALADKSKIVIMIILVQAVISGCLIYLSDIGGGLTSF